MDAIDLVREHFTSLGTKCIDVPEWKMQIYSTPVTLGEKNRLYRKSKDNDMELLVDVLIAKACNAEGIKLFTIEHRITFLNKADSNVIARVSNAILSADSPKADELKN